MSIQLKYTLNEDTETGYDFGKHVLIIGRVLSNCTRFRNYDPEFPEIEGSDMYNYEFDCICWNDPQHKQHLRISEDEFMDAVDEGGYQLDANNSSHLLEETTYEHLLPTGAPPATGRN